MLEAKQILDAVFVANDAIDSILRNKSLGMFCKLAIKKAYDHIK